MDAADEDLIDQELDSKDHPLGGAAGGAGLRTQLSADGGQFRVSSLFSFLRAVRSAAPRYSSYYFTDEDEDGESQYDFDDVLDDLEIDVVTDLGSFRVFEVDGFHAVLLVVDFIQKHIFMFHYIQTTNVSMFQVVRASQ